ncbi:MAG: MFS transporter [Candidatus Pacebacteria bacterium]|jgi:MFS family permease|nr:MFS transporter [Candidatus Paceibacterota bacterium]MBT4651955.1 MFS transporter [Candidatus Paceibacterota bacterium]MBT6755977.1 MFS transporter [Candidatus Paceibacterota bacterium]MBT6921411.1 MFS transporter [Candidatus Paceibacterota bacterium]
MKYFKDKTLFLYTLYRFVYGLYPINVIIALFFLAKGLNYADIAVVFGVFSVAGFLFEIPTGFFGDKFGRKASVIVGLLTMTITSIIWTQLETTMQFAFYAAVWMLGISFISGSLEAYIYDYLKDQKKLKIYDEIISFSGSVNYFAAGIGSIIGAYLFSINYNYPYYLLATFFCISAVIISFMKSEVKASESIAEEELSVFAGLKHIFYSKELLFITLFISLLYGFHSYYIHSVDKPYILSLELFDVKWLGVFVSMVYLLQALVVSQFAKLKKHLSEFQLISMSWFIYIVGLLGMSKLFGILGLLSSMIFYLSAPFKDAIINSFGQKHIPSKIRATTLSSIKVYESLVASVLAVIAGYVFDIFELRTALLIAAGYILGVFIFILLYKKVRNVRLEKKEALIQ